MKVELMCEVCEEVCEVVEISEEMSEDEVWGLLGIVVCDDCSVSWVDWEISDEYGKKMREGDK